jgi:hypothetical protein
MAISDGIGKSSGALLRKAAHGSGPKELEGAATWKTFSFVL